MIFYKLDAEGLEGVINMLLWLKLVVQDANDFSRLVNNIADAARQGTEKGGRHAKGLADVATLVSKQLIVQLEIIAKRLVGSNVVAGDAVDVGNLLQLGQGVVKGLGLEGAPRGGILRWKITFRM